MLGAKRDHWFLALSFPRLRRFLPLLRVSLWRWSGPAALSFLWRLARRAMKRSREARLRGEMRIECYFRERQLARCQFRHRMFQPHAAYVAVRWDSHCERKFARKMESAVTRDSG